MKGKDCYSAYIQLKSEFEVWLISYDCSCDWLNLIYRLNLPISILSSLFVCKLTFLKFKAFSTQSFIYLEETLSILSTLCMRVCILRFRVTPSN